MGSRALLTSLELYARAPDVLPGGVNSPVHDAPIGRDPIFVARGEGAELIDVEETAMSIVTSWGPLVAGHAHPEVVSAVQAAAAAGTSFGAPTEAEVQLAEEIAGRIRPRRWSG